jgi:hypothetical protein
MGEGFVVGVCSFFARLMLDRDELVVFSAGRGTPVAL